MVVGLWGRSILSLVEAGTKEISFWNGSSGIVIYVKGIKLQKQTT